MMCMMKTTRFCWKKLEKTQKERDFLFMGVIINIVKMPMSPKATYRSNTILNKIPMAFFIETVKKKKIFSHSFIWKHKWPQIAKTNLRGKNKASSSTLPNVKPSYKVIVIKTTSYWYEDRHIDRWNRIESSELNFHIDKYPRKLRVDPNLTLPSKVN